MLTNCIIVLKESGRSLLPMLAIVAFFLLNGCQSSRTSVIKGCYIEPCSCVPRIFFFPDVPNFRDEGGWTVADGMQIRRGRVFRSSCMNEGACWYRGIRAGTLISESTRNYITDQIGVKTDLDLRSESECAGMSESPLGRGVRYINIPSKSYGGLASQEGREAFSRVFRVFLDESNYPIVFHCAYGRDRAGSVAFVLGGLLGMTFNDLVADWNVSGLWYCGPSFTYERKLSRLVQVFDQYDGADLNSRIESYVLSLGFTREDISAFRHLMLEEQNSVNNQDKSKRKTNNG